MGWLDAYRFLRQGVQPQRQQQSAPILEGHPHRRHQNDDCACRDAAGAQSQEGHGAGADHGRGNARGCGSALAAAVLARGWSRALAGAVSTSRSRAALSRRREPGTPAHSQKTNSRDAF